MGRPKSIESKLKDAPTLPILLTIGDVSRLYRWSRSQTYKLLNTGKIRAVKEASTTLVVRESVDAYVASLKQYESRIGPTHPNAAA